MYLKASSQRSRYTRLRALSLTSKYLRHIAQPVLFHNITIRTFRQAVLALRSLFESPSLAESVRHLDFRVPFRLKRLNRAGHEWHLLYNGSYRDDLQLITAEARRQGLLPLCWDAGLLLDESRVDYSAKGLEETSLYARPMLTLLLGLVSNVKELTLACTSGLLNEFSTKRCHTKPPNLSGVRRLTIITIDTGVLNDHNPRHIPKLQQVQPAPLLAFCRGLESLEITAEIGEITKQRVEHSLAIIKPPSELCGLRNITEIILNKSSISKKALRAMMSFVGPNLRQFNYTAAAHGKQSKTLQVLSILKALRPWKNTLTHLVIECLEQRTGLVDPPPFADAVRFLNQTFSNLDTVKIGWVETSSISDLEEDMSNYLRKGRLQDGLCLDLLRRADIQGMATAFFHRPGLTDADLELICDPLKVNIELQGHPGMVWVGFWIPGNVVGNTAVVQAPLNGTNHVRMDVFGEEPGENWDDWVRAYDSAGILLRFRRCETGNCEK